MSYCRFGAGDVYMYAATDGIICQACKLNKSESKISLSEKIRNQFMVWLFSFVRLWCDLIVVLTLGFVRCRLPFSWSFKMIPSIELLPDPIFTKYSNALDHLFVHKEHGHIVPKEAIERLQNEINLYHDVYGVCEHGIKWDDNCGKCDSALAIRDAAWGIYQTLRNNPTIDHTQEQNIVNQLQRYLEE